MKRIPWTPILIVAAVIVIIAISVGMCRLGATPLMRGPEITPAPRLTPTSIIKSGPIIIKAIRNQAKLETVVMNIVNDQTITRVSGIGGLCTESITYLAYYDVVAGVDLAKIIEDNITVLNDGDPLQATVVITMPQAEILNITLDTQRSRVVSQNTPVWIPGCETQVADMTIEAQQRIQQYAEQAALQQGILKMAQEKASFELQRLLLRVGYPNVVIRYTER